MSIRLKLDGFDDLIKEIEKAGGKAESATMACMEKSAAIMQDELKTQMRNTEAPKNLIDAMPDPIIENDHGKITAKVGYKKGTFDPKNLSDGYKAVFLNYGTPYRKKHGKERARGFIQRAKSRAKRKINAEQEKTLKDILKGLKQ